MREWSDDNPYYLLILTDGQPTEIDLGSWRWAETYADLMRAPGEWYLVEKSTHRIPLSLKVWEGEQPYYVCRHIGMTGSAGGNEVKAYGIGKKRKVDGQWVTDRLWVLENGQVCGGDDVEPFARNILIERGPR